MAPEEYPERYLAGIELFNRGDFFEAHEVWEDLWAESTGDGHRFTQGLIQAAVGLCHFCNGNLRGAIKLYHSSRDYMERCPNPFWGLDIEDFWLQMYRCHSELLGASELTTAIEVDPELFPRIGLNPPPESWPDVELFLEEEHE